MVLECIKRTNIKQVTLKGKQCFWDWKAWKAWIFFVLMRLRTEESAKVTRRNENEWSIIMVVADRKWVPGSRTYADREAICPRLNTAPPYLRCLSIAIFCCRVPIDSPFSLRFYSEFPFCNLRKVSSHRCVASVRPESGVRTEAQREVRVTLLPLPPRIRGWGSTQF